MQRSTASSRSSPIHSLYAHALQSIFGFLSLADFNAAQVVCFRWQRASIACVPLRRVATVSGARLRQCAVSRLARHVTELQPHDACVLALDRSILRLIADRMPQLESIRRCFYICAPHPTTPLVFPASLRQLQLQAPADAATTPELMNRLLIACGKLQNLADLYLRLSRPNGAVDLTPLLQLTSLRSFSFEWLGVYIGPPFSAEQFTVIRTLSSLTRLDMPHLWRAESQSELFEPPHELSGLLRISASNASLQMPDSVALSILPRLQRLQQIDVRTDGQELLFLQLLPQLTHLTLRRADQIGVRFAPVAAVLASASCAAGLLRLELDNFAATSALLASFLPAMVRLTALDVSMHSTALDSLAFLSAAPALRTSLLELRLIGLPDSDQRLSAAEFVHLRSLRCLRSLRLGGVVSGEVIDAKLLSEYQAPARKMPALLSLVLEQL